MPDREKAIKGLECCIIRHPDDKPRCDECPYESACCNRLKYDALELLKAQEPLSVQKKQIEMIGLQTWDWVCGNCGQTVLFSAKYCPWCGKAVKWDG